MELKEALLNRRSIRKFTEEPVSEYKNEEADILVSGQKEEPRPARFHQQL